MAERVERSKNEKVDSVNIVLGVDNGYAETKNSVGVVFPSTIRPALGFKMLGPNEHEVIIDGEKLIVGDKNGEQDLDDRKYTSKVSKFCLLTSIALATQATDITVDLVVGVPAGEYDDDTEKELQDIIFAYGDPVKITIDETEKTITINSVLVLPQGVGPVYLHEDKYGQARLLVIDIGGKTTDTVLVDHKSLVKTDSIALGVAHLKSELTSLICKTRKISSISETKINEAIKTHMIDINGIKVDVREEVTQKINEFTAEIKKLVQTNYRDYKTLDYIILMGGGATIFESYLSKVFGNLEMESNSQLTNAKAYEQVGRELAS